MPPSAILFVWLFRIGLQQVVLNIPQALRQVNIVVMRIVESFDFVPQGIHLLQAILSDFLQIRTLIDQFTILKNGYLQFLRGKIIDGFGKRISCFSGRK